MASPNPLGAEKPVYVSPLDPEDRFRLVRVVPLGPAAPQVRPCAGTDELVEFVSRIRPDLDLSSWAGEIYWAGGHPWEWSGI